MAFSACSFTAGAAAQESRTNGYPVVLVTGYTSANLFITNEDGTRGEKIWSIAIDEILGLVLKRIAEVGIGLGASVFGKGDYLAKVVGEEAINLLGKTACNDDGSSKYPVEVMFPTAEVSNSQVMFDEFGNDDYQFETDITKSFREYVDRSEIYNFNVDWRYGAVYCATELDDYIQQVKELTGKDKVNIFAVSHGGQVTATYLSLFGYKQDVQNAVLTVPAIRGAGILYDLLQVDMKFDELNLINFIENGLHLEEDLHWLVEAQQLGFLDDVLNKLIPYLFEVVGNWGSIWDFCPDDIYEAMKAKWLDPVKNKGLIEKSDYMHYTVMPSFSTALEKCNEEYGMHVSIIAGTDNGMTTGNPINGDGIIATSFATGATCADRGMRFADGYTQVNPCDGKYKVSPEMTVDASTAYLPDNTWFVSGLFHGMTYWDLYTRELMPILLLTDEIKDVYSDERFPQFHTSTNPCYGVWAAFDSSDEGFVSSGDKALVIKNLTWENRPVLINGITCDGMDLDFDLKPLKKIKAGESITVPFTGEIPAKSDCVVSVTISFETIGSVTPVAERTLYFTLKNGEKVTGEGGTVSLDAVTPFEKSPFAFMKGFLEKLGIYKFVSMIYTMITVLFGGISKIF